MYYVNTECANALISDLQLITMINKQFSLIGKAAMSVSSKEGRNWKEERK